MAIKTVQIEGYDSSYSEDCIVLKNAAKGSNRIIMALPFHEDTPNLSMTTAEAMDLRNALDELVRVPLIEHKKEAI